MIGIHYDSYSNEVHTWVHFDTCPAEISIWSLGSVLPSSGLCCSLRCDQTVRWGRWWLWCRSWNIFSRKWSQWFDGVWRYFGMPKFESGLKGLFFSIGGLWLNCFDSKKNMLFQFCPGTFTCWSGEIGNLLPWATTIGPVSLLRRLKSMHSVPRLLVLVFELTLKSLKFEHEWNLEWYLHIRFRSFQAHLHSRIWKWSHGGHPEAGGNVACLQ